MMKQIRQANNMTVKEVADECGVPANTIYYLESGKRPVSSQMLTMYLNNLDLTEESQKMLKEKRKSNWSYNDDFNAMTNELIRIRNGLGCSMSHLSNLFGRHEGYWLELEKCGRGLNSDELDILDIEFRLSSNTIKRLRIAEKMTLKGKPMPDIYQDTNPEVTEPLDLYEYQPDQCGEGRYMELLTELEDEFEDTDNVPHDDPRLKEYKKCLGVIYYDS